MGIGVYQHNIKYVMLMPWLVGKLELHGRCWGPEAVFLVTCNPSMYELWATKRGLCIDLYWSRSLIAHSLKGHTRIKIQPQIFYLKIPDWIVYLVSIDVEGVVVEPGVPDEGWPLVPTFRNPVSVVLVQVLPEVAWNRYGTQISLVLLQTLV